MTEFQNKATKKLYLKSKLIVRRWEDEFSNKNGRLPTRADIKLSPAYVRESYHRYYKIKTELLASQILDDNDLMCDVTDTVLTTSNSLIENNHVEETEKHDDNKGLESTPNGSVTKNSPNKEICSETWSENLNVKKPEKTNKEIAPSINILSQKLFKGSKFNKRNPRKPPSFTRKKSDSCQSFTNSVVNSQDDSNCSINLNSSSFDTHDMNESSVNELNESVSNMRSSMDSSTPSFSSLSSSILSSSSFLSSSTIVSGVSKPDKYTLHEERSQPAQKVSLIQEVGSLTTKRIPTYHEGWVERCVDMRENREPQRNSDSGFDSMENSPPLPSESKETAVEDTSSDDDVIGDSDNERDNDSKSAVSAGSQKRKAPVLNPPEESTASKPEEKSPSTPILTQPKKKIRLDSREFESHSKENVKKAILQRKIESGSLNDNYVKINLERKTYVRGKKIFNFSRYKKQQWKKDKKMLAGNGRESGGLVQCFKCGEKGHFTRKCKAHVEGKLLEADNEDEEDDEDVLPTLEEAQKMLEEKARLSNFKKKNVFTVEKPPPEESVDMVKVEPLYQLKEDGLLIKTPAEVYEALEEFGHSEFRTGQEQAVMRILSGLSTLLMISTGGGKSLCYQLPAYLYAKRSNCITLVISPLVSLMEDQVSGSSSVFKAGCLHTSQTQKQRETVLEDVRKGKLHALLVSPEAVVSADSFKGFGGLLKQLPPIAFACIDEVHCISQWSHNFRPSYLMINKVLKEKFGVRTILGLTATATISSVKSITNELGISSEKDVIKDIPLPDNIFLSISRDEDRDDALIQLLKSSKFEEYNAILIYCTKRDDCERLAVLIRTVLQNSAPQQQPQQRKRRNLSWSAESYHAGMAAARRKQVQKAFMTGNLRIVVATVAFGMGINKQDIRAVIHYNMPRDFESYVQETGRAGRDGLPTHCHLFLDPHARDLNELRRHIYANSIDRHVLRKLLQRVFVDCDCKEKGQSCEGHEIAFNIQDTVQALDLPEENIFTLLCYLELHDNKFVKVLAPAYLNCRVKSYKGLKQINLSASKCAPLAYVCALNALSKKKKSACLEFNVMEIARKIGWDSSLVKSQLKNLEWEVREDSSWKKTGIIVEFYDLGFRILARGDMSPKEQDEALDYLTERVENQEKRASALLNMTYGTLDHFACSKYSDAVEVIDQDNSNELKTAIRHYFETEKMLEEIPLKNLQELEFDEEFVASDVRTLICTYRENTFNARSVARIFHGIQSPNYPASLWYNCRFWRKHVDKDFNKIIQIAKLEILKMKL